MMSVFTAVIPVQIPSLPKCCCGIFIRPSCQKVFGEKKIKDIFASLFSGAVSSSGLCESSSVGRAQPCQGWGRGFESRLSLVGVKYRKVVLFQEQPFFTLKRCPGGGMVDTLDLKSNGQKRSCGFKSRPGYKKSSHNQ